MKTTIDFSGTLTIKAETELEAFALREWWKDYQKDKKFILAVDLESHVQDHRYAS